MNLDEWFVPGGAFVSEQLRIRIVPPITWTKVAITIKDVPPSMNTNEIRSHWTGFQKQKKLWQGQIETELMVQRVKRDGYQRAMAGAFLTFPPGGRRRDTNNFSTLLNKALGDALARDSQGRGYGAIPDDDERRYYFGGVEFTETHGPLKTELWIFLQPHEEEG